ncbi:potassium ion transporter [Aspergillus chevalieri]|uniref:Potassium transport protein n=1 Tax=Aspergillus chevalieri TaxID=182096 RepID=A0A7R7ZPP6_ASPCH|nr:low affinity potassium transporter [Aspergillus chevalieri]BCR89823.1 low affinity potassium transporter [Aspergillus chevalieri]
MNIAVLKSLRFHSFVSRGRRSATARSVARMFSKFIEKTIEVKSRIPFVRDIHMNFILLHYTYIICLSFIASIIIYPGTKLAYIDALFFSAGAATQSGLNTVDFNLLHTYQQVILYFISMLTTPIFIHTVLVFIRLYWFEKRFQHVVRDARNLRATRTRMRTVTEGKEDDDDSRDYDREERGITSRPIVVLRNESGDAIHKTPQGSPIKNQTPDGSDSSRSPTDTRPANGEDSNNSSDREDSGQRTPRLGLGSLRVPSQVSPDQHIAFLEHQRKSKGALRIPSPREYDRGGMPEVLEEDDDGERLARQRSRESHEAREADDEVPPMEGPHITINEPEITRTKTRQSTIPRMDTRPTFRETKDTSDASPFSRARRGTMSSIVRSFTQERDRPTLPYLSWDATVGRNSNFVDLTEEQRDELGGIEYRALKTLAVVLIAYYVGFHLLGVVCMVPWIMHTHWGSVVQAAGQGRPWWGIFTSGSAFNDVGFTLTADSMNSFQGAIFPMLFLAFLIIIGNTGFPCMLRLIIWVCSKLVPVDSPLWEELKFLLDHPRRCFTLLFPRNATWWLFAILIALNGIDLIFFIILDLNDPAVTALPAGIRVLDGLFQAACTRTAGFSVVSISDLHPAVQVSYMIMMYISVFPIAISMRRTNVYEEKSLGIYPTEPEDEEDEDQQTAPTYIGAHLRKQLSFDLWYVFLGLFIISIVEGGRLKDTGQYSFQLWSVLFEVVSAYGTVGLSMGYPGVNTSFVGEFQVISKLVIIAMQVRGRHRGLPYSLDRAILLPSEALNQQEIADGERRMRRRASNLSGTTSMDRQQSQARTETGVSTGLDARDRDSFMNADAVLHRHGTLRSQRSQR